MVRSSLFVLAVIASSSCARKQATTSARPEPTAKDGLQAPSAFDSIEQETARSAALFDEVAKVLRHPRCINCHPDGERPAQGQGVLHQPLVVRGPDGFGAPGLPCSSCHGSENFENVPGNPKWHLAPASMAWQGKSNAAICAQLKDRERNGNKSLEELEHHMKHDELVAYGWNPPEHLPPAPGTQALAGALFAAWRRTGAHCPPP